MRVDGYEVVDSAIAKVIDKLCEADGSPDAISAFSYLADASRLLSLAIWEISEEHYTEKAQGGGE